MFLEPLTPAAGKTLYICSLLKKIFSQKQPSFVTSSKVRPSGISVELVRNVSQQTVKLTPLLIFFWSYVTYQDIFPGSRYSDKSKLSLADCFSQAISNWSVRY